MSRIFQNRYIPDDCELIGYSWLIDKFNLNLPLRDVSLISNKRLASQKINKEYWTCYDSTFKPKKVHTLIWNLPLNTKI